jgi:hypothetical protein
MLCDLLKKSLTGHWVYGFSLVEVTFVCCGHFRSLPLLANELVQVDWVFMTFRHVCVVQFVSSVCVLYLFGH